MESGKTCMVVLVEGLSTDPSGACSACAVASLIRGKHTDVSLCPDVVCHLNIAWCNPARESFPTAVRETWWHKMPYFRNGPSLSFKTEYPHICDKTAWLGKCWWESRAGSQERSTVPAGHYRRTSPRQLGPCS